MMSVSVFCGCSLLGDHLQHRDVEIAALSHAFVDARALPAGSRPPPPDVDIQAILGVSESRLRSALGRPDRTEQGESFDCGAEHCLVFTYGSTKRQEPLVVKQENGLSTIVVVTGGPWLLVVGIAENRVVAAKWQGQK